MDHKILRLLAGFCHLAVFISSFVVTGIVSYLILKQQYSGLHIIWEIIISTITLGLYLVFTPLAFYGYYRGHMVLVHFFFFAMWFVSLVFSGIDWAGTSCGKVTWSTPLPILPDKCGHKHSVVAFSFLAMFFLFCGGVVEGLLWKSGHNKKPASAGSSRENLAGEKHNEHNQPGTAV